MKDLYNFLDNNIVLNDNDYVVVGLSGGPDSMALVDILKHYYNNINIVCAHVHHNLRKESDEEKIFVQKYCNENNLIFEFFKIENYSNDKFTEEEARKIRYDFFDSVIKKYNAKYLFTAHHGDDLIETMLMRLVRGSNFKGYSGINTISIKNCYQVVRPLIFLTKDEIMNYIDKNNIEYVVDNSNTNLKYTRNRYRMNILPELKKENANVHQKFYKLSNMIVMYDNFVSKYVDNIYDNIVNDNIINIDLLKKEDELIWRNVIERYLYDIYGDNITLITDKNVCDILKVIINNKPNMRISFPSKYTFIKEYNNMYLKKEEVVSEYQYEIKDEVKIENKTIKIVSSCNLSDNNVIYLNSMDIKLPLYIRNYKTGDKILIKNMKNYKKVKDIFINEKVPVSARRKYPLLVDSNNEVLWIPGLKKSHFDSQKTGKYDIILTYY